MIKNKVFKTKAYSILIVSQTIPIKALIRVSSINLPPITKKKKMGKKISIPKGNEA